MTDTEVKPETKSPEVRKPKLTVRSAASITLVVVGGVAAVGLLAVGGWIAAAAVPVAAGTGLYARHRMKNPRRTTGRKFTWSRTRRTLSPSGKTGLPSALRTGTKAGSRKASLLPRGHSGKLSTGSKRSGKGSGLRLPKTTRSRARSGAGGALPKHKASRPVSRTTSPMTKKSSASKPRGTRTPKTPSRTPARPNRRPVGLTGSSKRPASGRTTSPTRARRSSTGRAGLPRVLPKRSGGSRKGSGSASKSTPRRSAPSRTNQKRSGLFTRRPLSPKTSGTTGRRPGRTVRQKLNPFRRTSPSGKYSTARNPLKRTKPKMRTGNPDRMKRRDRIPRRTPSRPRPYKRVPARSLWRLALGLPSRTTRKGKSRIARPTTAQRRRARRTLRLRSLARVWSLRKLPGRFSRWHWDRIFARVPGPVNADWLKPTPLPTPPKPPTPTPPTGPGLAPVIPIRKDVTAMSSTPHETIADAFGQLAQFTPESATDMARFWEFHHEMFAQISQAYETLADRMQSEMPFGASTADSARDLGAAFGGLGGIAQEVHATFRNEHADELARLESPRPNEQMWDTGLNG